MSLDMDLWKPIEKENVTIRIGWAGAPHNLPYLERLESVFQRVPSVELHVFSGHRPKLSIPFVYHPFSEESQIPFIQNLDIGLLPLPKEEFALGKSPIKALQYMACGIPVIGNIYGATCDILKESFSLKVESEDDWVEAIQTLSGDPALRKNMGQKAREEALAKFSLKVTQECYRSHLCSIL